jgi:putative DNA primase/helicase
MKRARYRSIRLCRLKLTAGQETGFSGIGFVFAHNAPYVGIDLDDTHGDEKAFADQQHIYKEFDSYTELSPSGNGVHIIVKGKLPGPGRRRYFVELYDTDRYFTMTGNVINPRPIAERQQLKLNSLYEHMGAKATVYPVGEDQAEKEPDSEIITQSRSCLKR